MKNIEYFKADKYKDPKYKEIEEHIYKTEDSFMGEECFVMSLCFEQEPEYEEGLSPQDISQYPLEDIIDKYYVAIEDFYQQENNISSSVCCLEFSGTDLGDIKRLKEIIGKHVYNKVIEENGQEIIKLIIE